MEILIKRLDEQAKLPVYSREAGPGIDLYTLHEVTIAPGETVHVSTGVALAIPVGYVALVWSQHSIVINDAIKVTASLVDSGHRDEIIVELTNTGAEARTFAAGAQVAQLLVQQIHHAQLIEAEDFSNNEHEIGV